MLTGLRRTLAFLHRWSGAALCALFLLWFLSGIVLIYRSYPSLTVRDYLQHAPTIDPAGIRVPVAVAISNPRDSNAAQLMVTTFDGRPVYVAGNQMIYADDGRRQETVSGQMVDRAAAAWTGQPLRAAVRTTVNDVDQWTLSGGLRTLRPMFKYAWPDGQEVYVSGSAEVVQYTTRESRFWAYLGAIPHWLYLPALRTQDAAWDTFMVWASLAGTLTAIAGLVIAAWMFSPRRRYRLQGAPTSIPYRSWKRWHMVIGLGFGVATVTWVFSGLLTLEPFRLEDRLTAWTVSRPAASEANLEAWTRMTGELLGRRLDLEAYTGKPPDAAIASIAGFGVKVLEFSSIRGEPIYLATNGRGETMIVPVHGAPVAAFDAADLMRRLRVAGGAQLGELTLMDSYDAYYRDRNGVLPLPVIYARMQGVDSPRYYVDPKTATVVGSYAPEEWVGRWLHHGLHSLDLPWLYTHRPLWDIVVIALMLGGTALCVTSLVLAWKMALRVITPSSR